MLDTLIGDVITKKCTKCGIKLPATKEYFAADKRGKYGFVARCRRCANEYSKQYTLNNVEKLKKKRRKYRLKNFERLNKNQRQYRIDHHDEIVQYDKNRWCLDRIRCIEHYGGSCVVCGESRIKFLVLDHVDNNGNVDRGGRGDKVCRRIIRNNFPLGFQVLCWNHNWLKHLNLVKSNSNNTRVRYRRIVKQIVMDAYGNKCICCGEDNPDLLTIDHINGNGSQHRREVKSGGHGFYRWIINHRFPDNLRLLCWNCNCGLIVNDTIKKEALCHA